MTAHDDPRAGGPALEPRPRDDGSTEDAAELTVLAGAPESPGFSSSGQLPGRGRALRPWVVAVGAVLLTGGVALAVLAASVLGDAATPMRVVLFLVGVGVAYGGLARLIRGVWGPAIDVPYCLSAAWLCLLVGAAVLAPVLPIGEANNTAATLSSPVNARPDLFSANPLGTNQLGLDLLARIIYGARTSLLIALVAATLGFVVGGTVGLVSGYLRGAVDTVVGVITNVLLAFPPLVLLLAVAAVLPRTARSQALVLALLVIPTNVRLARAATLTHSKREFVLAARAIGAKRRRIMITELAPNVFIPLFSYAFIVIAILIVAEASLSFLGLGIPQPRPTWGNMIAEARGGAFQRHPHLLLVPASALFMTVLSFNLVGERLRQRLSSGKRLEL